MTVKLKELKTQQTLWNIENDQTEKIEMTSSFD